MFRYQDNKTAFQLGAILLLAFALRLIGVGEDPLWGDEALTVVLSEWSIADMFRLPTDPTPFLYYALHKIFFPPDAPAALMRLISLTAGVASVAVMYALARAIFETRGALIAALLLAVSTVHVDYSIEARAYSLAFLFTLCMSASLLYYTKTQSRTMLACFALASVLAFYTHMTAVFWIAATGVILFLYMLREGRGRAPEIIAAFAAMAVFAAPGLWRMGLQMAGGDSFGWLEQADPMRFISNQAELYLPLGFWDNDVIRAAGLTNKVKMLILALSGAGIAMLCWIGGRVVFQKMRSENPWGLALIAAYLITPFIVWWIGYIARPVYMTRAVLFCLPGFILLLSALFLQFPPKKTFILTGITAMLFVCSLVLQGFSLPKADWRGAVSYIRDNIHPGDAIALCPHYAWPALRHAAQSGLPAPVVAFKKDTGLIAMDGHEDWSRHYYETILVPAYNAELSKIKTPAIYERNILRVRTLWAVNICKGKAASDFEEQLSRYGDASAPLWKDSVGEIAVNSYTPRRAISIFVPQAATPH